MGWFRPSGDNLPTLASVFKAGASSAAGAGALLSPRYVLTCAHVVADALGEQQTDTEPPTRSACLRVVLRQGAQSHRSTARPVVWVPPRRSPGSNWGAGDLAVLELDDPAAPSMPAVVWQDMTEWLEVRAYHGGGDPGTFADTRVKARDTWYYYADADLSGASVQHGYSGGPLFKQRDPTVAVGLVTRHLMNDRLSSDRQVMRRTLTVPWQHIRDELRRAGARDVLNALSESVIDAGKVPEGAVGCLWELFDSKDKLETAANRLARRLGLHMAAEEPAMAVLHLEEELAALLFSEGRALATLDELLMKRESSMSAEDKGHHRKAVRRLVAYGREVEGVRLLSVGEHERLLALLTPVNTAQPRLLCQAARHVLQLADRLPAWVSDGTVPQERLAAAVDDLDRDSADMMPPLLRLAVFLSAAVTDKAIRSELDAWCDDVGRRLDRDPSLLAEYRAQASRWVRSLRRPVTRIVVDLSRNDAVGEPYTCYFWRVSEGRAPEATGVSAGPYTAEELGRTIHRLAGDQGGFPRIDVVVGARHLHLPVDGWTASTGQETFGPLGISTDSGLVLGAEYQVTMRLREFFPDMERERGRRADIERRWAAGRTDPLVIKDGTELRIVHHELRDKHRDAPWVVLHGGRKFREDFLKLCVGLGVPVVLWDREAAHVEHARRLDGIVGGVALPDLPTAVQELRQGVYYGKRTDPARPAVVWDDPDTVLPTPPDYDDPPDGMTDSGRMAAR